MRSPIRNSRTSGKRAWPAAVLAAAVCSLAASNGVAQEPLDLGAKSEPEQAADDGAEQAVEGAGETAAEEAPIPAPDVGLDELLRLPNSLDFKEERRGGGGAADWRRRFRESEDMLASARENLARTEQAMDEAAVAGSGQWQIAPPGQQANSSDNGPLSFKLREDLRRARTRLEDAERKHRALIVEADLSSVPVDWRGSVE